MSVVILLGVSIIIFGLTRVMPTDFVDDKYSSALSQGTITQDEVDRIKEIYGLAMPDAYITVKVSGESKFAKYGFTKNAKTLDREHVNEFLQSPSATDEEKANALAEWYVGQYEKTIKKKTYRIYLNSDGSYELYRIESSSQEIVSSNDENGESESDSSNSVFVIVDKLVLEEEGLYTVNADESITVRFGEFTRSGITDKIEQNADGSLKFTPNGKESTFKMKYSVASGWDKAGAIFKSYFNWLGKMLKGDLGLSFKYNKPVAQVIKERMGISFVISFVATILQFLIAIPLGIKAATHQYGVVDYTVTILAMMGISLPTFFAANLFIRLFAVKLGIFPSSGLNSSLPVTASSWTRFIDAAWHLVLPMTVLVILSIGGLMRYTRTNTLEVLNADYIRTARAKGLSEHTVVYKHAFKNTMIPLVTMFAGILPGLFSGAMITETVFSIPGIGKYAYDALVAKDIPFIMGYNMFMAVLTVLGTLLSDLMYAVVDPRVKISG